MYESVDRVLELIVQVQPEKLTALGEVPLNWIVAILTEIKGRFSRVCVRSGSTVLPREPSLEEVERLPLLEITGSLSKVSDNIVCWGEIVAGQLQMNVCVREDMLNLLNKKSLKHPNGQELVANDPALFQKAVRKVVRLNRSSVKLPQFPSRK